MLSARAALLFGEDSGGGERLAAAMARWPGASSPVYVAMVRAGEAGRFLHAVLQQIADFRQRELELKGKMQTALVYPIILTAFAAVVLVFLLTFFIPCFSRIFERYGSSLPSLMRAVVAVRQRLGSDERGGAAGVVLNAVAGGRCGSRKEFRTMRARMHEKAGFWNPLARWARGITLLALELLLVMVPACKSPGDHRRSADRTAHEIIESKQRQALGRTEPLRIEPPADALRRRLLIGQDLQYAAPASLGSYALELPPHWPNDDYIAERRQEVDPVPPWLGEQPLELSLDEALAVAARNSRDFQSQKERVFLTALDLDLERDAFETTFTGALTGGVETNLRGEDTTGVAGGATLGASRRLRNGALLSTAIGIDLVRLLTQDRASAMGIFADATVSIPLLRGSGRHIVLEPLTQAERNVVYALWDFETFKRGFAVQVTTSYLDTLEQAVRLANAEANYRGLIGSTRRARRLADAGRLPEIQVDQALQNELRARDRWISAQQAAAAALDRFKVLLGLPTDALIGLVPEELELLTQGVMAVRASRVADEPAGEVPPADVEVELLPPDPADAGPLELPEPEAVALALAHRLDLRTLLSRVEDAQRAVVVAADLLRPGLDLLGTARIGERRSVASAGAEDASLRFDEGRYAALLTLDLPLERTAERNLYRQAYVNLERAVRNVQQLEDQIKLEVRNNLRSLLEARESLQIQARAVAVAERRVASTDMFLQAGRAEIRDVLEAQEALLTAQNALTSALVNYRVSELELQRDMGVLEVTAEGVRREYLSQETTP